MKKLLIILLFFISNLYAFLTDPGVILTDPTKFIRKKFTTCDELYRDSHKLYIYDNIYFSYQKKDSSYQYYYYKPYIRVSKTFHKGFAQNNYSYLYIYNQSSWVNLIISEHSKKLFFYKACFYNTLMFENPSVDDVKFPLKNIEFFEPQKDYIIPRELQQDPSLYKKLHCQNLQTFIQENSVNGSIYFVYLNTLYKAYLHKNGPLFMFVTENKAKYNYWSHDEGVLDSLEGDFIYDKCDIVINKLIFDNLKHNYKVYLDMNDINFVPLNVNNNILDPSILESPNYQTVEIKTCSQYTKFVTKDSNLINTRIYFKHGDVYYFIENNFLFIYENNEWTMHLNNYSNPQCIKSHLMFDTIVANSISQQSVFDLVNLKFFIPNESKLRYSESGKPQWRKTTHNTEREINTQELELFVDDKQRSEPLSDDKSSELKDESEARAISPSLSDRSNQSKENLLDLSSEFEDKNKDNPYETESRTSKKQRASITDEKIELQHPYESPRQTTGETGDKTTSF